MLIKLYKIYCQEALFQQRNNQPNICFLTFYTVYTLYLSTGKKMTTKKDNASTFCKTRIKQYNLLPP